MKNFEAHFSTIFLLKVIHCSEIESDLLLVLYLGCQSSAVDNAFASHCDQSWKVT